LAREGTQLNSKLSSTVEQGRLPLSRTPKRADDISVEIIARQPNLLAAINLCIDVSGLEDKEIQLALDIDAGHFSNIRKGKTGCHFPTNKIDDLQTLCGNEIPLAWQALKRGKGLHLLETEAERQLRDERRRREEAEIKLRALQEAIAGRFGSQP
jgi:hypothetical protein